MKDAPLSPYVYRQEMYRNDPWKMLLVCMMLNQTTAKQVDKVREQFFDKYPTPEALLCAKDEEVISIIRPLGFYNKRCVQWKAFSQQWLDAKWKNVLELKGVGKYAHDSWKIFQEGDLSVEPTDKELIKYLEWAKKQ